MSKVYLLGQQEFYLKKRSRYSLQIPYWLFKLTSGNSWANSDPKDSCHDDSFTSFQNNPTSISFHTFHLLRIQLLL